MIMFENRFCVLRDNISSYTIEVKELLGFKVIATFNPSHVGYKDALDSFCRITDEICSSNVVGFTKPK